ncbi:hypothetical protein [Thauera sp. SDU_THAU2]|uniref:hypothetical protein n=1 Tax=Thauera sp. SDU_THAU2 TaxID=3136633 RepID=UPI00311F7C44
MVRISRRTSRRRPPSTGRSRSAWSSISSCFHLLKPGLIGASLLVLLLAWHNFALGLMLSSTKTPVTVALLKLLNPGVQFYPVMAAGLVITMIVPGHPDRRRAAPSRERGLTFGAVK